MANTGQGSPGNPDSSTDSPSTHSPFNFSVMKPENRHRLSKIKTQGQNQIPKQTLKSMIYAVGHFESWLWQSYAHEIRSTTEIPEKDLNSYFAEFFQKAVLRDRKEFPGESFRTIKCLLFRYLRETGYHDGDMFHSSAFQKAKESFEKKMDYLHEVERMERTTQVMSTSLGGNPVVPRSPQVDHRKATAREIENLNRRSKILPERLEQIPRQTVTSMTAAVGTFERWFQRAYPGDQRQFIEIPPEQLNQFLVEFFKVILLPHGMDYKPESFHSLKCYLFRYLRETGYDRTSDMFNSAVFAEAKLAFKAKKRYLEKLDKEMRNNFPPQS